MEITMSSPRIMPKKLLANFFLALLTFNAAPVFAASNSVLKQDDFVGISFWIISMALVASTVFFFLERDRVAAKWKTSLTVSGLVTLVTQLLWADILDVRAQVA